jgi:ribosomal protein S25
MNLFFIFLLGVVFGAGMALVIAKRKIKEIEIELKRTEKEKEEEEKIASGLEGFNQKIQEIKEERKRRILEELEGRRKIRANEVADIFTISRTTAFRYLEELEQEGKIEQIGVFGPNVHYRVKK